MVACPICEGPSKLLFATRDYARPSIKGEFALYWCSRCAFGRLAGDFTAEEIRDFYPTDYYTHTADWEVESERSFADRVRIHLAWLSDQGKHFHPSELAHVASVCDIGCGNGHDLRLFDPKLVQRVGVDPDPLARTTAADAGEIYCGTAEHLPAELAGRQFDAVLLSHVLEHCIDPSLAIRNLEKILAPRGTISIEVPNANAIGFSRYRACWPWSDIPRHLNFFTEASLRALLRRSGLEVTNVIYVGLTRQFTPNWMHKQNKIRSALGEEKRDNSWDAWLLLARSMFAASERRYDSIRVHARREPST